MYNLRRNKNDDVTKLGGHATSEKPPKLHKNRENRDVATTAEKVPFFK